MPLVFVTDAPTLWEREYADIVGMQYEFPKLYRAMVESGERFIYYRGSRGAKQGGVGYFGDGIVGQVRPSSKPDHLIAMVHDVDLYVDVIGIRDGARNYLETGSTKGTNWANGVRRISDEVFTRITGEGHPALPSGPPLTGYADPAHTSAMERYSVKVAMDLLAEEFGASAVREMPPGNPGYDIQVDAPDGGLHVEVKGTILPTPVFHLSEGQRRHADLLGGSFRLIVVYDIDQHSGSHHIQTCTGPITTDRATLQPASWTGVLIPATCVS